MARTPRGDGAGTWHHVTNRGIARRPVFEGKEDVRHFLALVARAVRRGEIELHAFAVLTTHFHLLLRSPAGRMSAGMRRIQNGYVRWFNRRRRRDGPLFRGRFLSKPVESLTYRRILVRYIDQNAPQARLAHAPELYPYGSAAHFARGAGPPWLCRDWIEAAAQRSAGTERYTWSAYMESFGVPLSSAEAELVERRIEHRSRGPDPLDDLVGAAPREVRSWMRRKAELADGTRPGLPLAGPALIENAVEEARAGRPDWVLRRGRWGSDEVDPWRILLIWLLRHVGGQTQGEVALRLRVREGSLTRLQRSHLELLREVPEYEEVATRITKVCLDRCRVGNRIGESA